MPDGGSTIVALATPRGRGALAVIRVSGPEVGTLLRRLTRVEPKDVKPRESTLLRLWDADEGQLLDQAVVTLFPGPGSYTGEDLLEISVHGGILGPQRVVEALVRGGARMAEPGEFTRRRWAAGKMDRLQVEALDALIEADTPMRHRLALARLEGGLSRRLDTLRDRLLQVEAFLAHHLDFPDEDEPPTPLSAIVGALGAVEEQLRLLKRSAPVGRRIRSGALVVLAGRPNAGKSSLFNALLGEERVLVSPEAGTTRDVVEVGVEIGGAPVRLLDTAGIRDEAVSIEASGIEMARRWLESADLIVWLHRYAWGEPRAEDRRWLDEISGVARGEIPVLPVASCMDEGVERGDPSSAGGWSAVHGERWIPLSVESGEGFSAVKSRIGTCLLGAMDEGALMDEGSILVRQEESLAVSEALESVMEASRLLDAGHGAELAAVEVRHARETLAAMVGPIEEEAVLDRLFSTFCIGK